MHTLVFHIIDLAKRLSKVGFQTEPKYLSYSETNALLVINSQKQISQIEIANKLHLKPASVVTLIDELEKLHLVKRKILADNRRKYQIALTDQGKFQAKKIASRIQLLEKSIRDQLLPKEADSFYKTVEKLNRHLENWPSTIYSQKSLEKGGET